MANKIFGVHTGSYTGSGGGGYWAGQGSPAPAPSSQLPEWIAQQQQQQRWQNSPQFNRPEDYLINMIRSRFHMDPIERLPFAHIYAHRAYCDNTGSTSGDVYVVVWSKPDDAPVVLQDGWDLFPSDTLMTQLRLLAG